MEKRLASLENNLPNEPTADQRLGMPVNTWHLPTLAVVLTSFIAVLSYELGLPIGTSRALLLTSIFCPLPIAGLLGYMTTRRMGSERGVLVQHRMRGFLILGLAAGVLTFGSILALEKLHGQRVIASDFWGAATIWILGSVVLFAAGGFVGRWLGKKGEYDQYSWTARVANKLVTRKAWGGHGQGQADEHVKRLAAFLSALAPILALIGSIITGYFTYLAAAARGK